MKMLMMRIWQQSLQKCYNHAKLKLVGAYRFVLSIKSAVASSKMQLMQPCHAEMQEYVNYANLNHCIYMTGSRVTEWQPWWWLGPDTEDGQHSMPNNTEDYAASDEE